MMKRKKHVVITPRKISLSAVEKAHRKKKRSDRSTTKPDECIRISSMLNRRLTAPDIKALSTSAEHKKDRTAKLIDRLAARKDAFRRQNMVEQLAWAKKHKTWPAAE